VSEKMLNSSTTFPDDEDQTAIAIWSALLPVVKCNPSTKADVKYYANSKWLG